jgi:hypothetical protein
MKLNFDCRPFYEPSVEVVKFVGWHQDVQGLDQFVLCRVSRDALEHLGQVTTTDPEQLIEVFHAMQGKIYTIATAQYAVGNRRPLITKDDVLKSLTERV